MASIAIENTLIDNTPVNRVHFYLPKNDRRPCDIKVFSDRVVFEGKFRYLKDKKICWRHTYKDTALIKNFIGMEYLAKHSLRKCMTFILGGTALEIIRAAIDRLSIVLVKINNYLQWADRSSIELPEWMAYSMNTIAFVCVALGIIFLFSEEKVVEISFTDKRICVPQKSISNTEYTELYQAIKSFTQSES